MAINLRKSAKNANTLSVIMIDRTKGDTEELITRNTPVHINNCEFIVYIKQGKQEEQWCYTIEEEPNKFYFSGKVMFNTFQTLLEECEGNYQELYESVRTYPLIALFKQGKTSEGLPITLVEFLEK